MSVLHRTADVPPAGRVFDLGGSVSAGLAQRQSRGYGPSLAGKVARSTGEYTVEQIAAEIAEVARA